jgi:hypothetical protein
MLNCYCCYCAKLLLLLLLLASAAAVAQVAYDGLGNKIAIFIFRLRLCAMAVERRIRALLMQL